MKKFILISGLFLLTAAPIVLLPLLESYLTVTRPQNKTDALVLMAGSIWERLPPLVELYEQGVSDKILLTNDGVLGRYSKEHGRNLYHVEWAEQALLKRGVAAEAIVKLPYSASGTYYDASHAVDYARAEGMKSLVVVTSDYHTRRTLWSFNFHAKNESISIGVYPGPNHKGAAWNLHRLKVLLGEFVKLVYYQVRYGLTTF
ncbi:YdcF family protein [Desulfuromonas sp. KJ2020]|uniref:YdcF family protein n=1 Tax=Desulfuromonas sp. KJ2020 TaxID=2919173 RepID=UPI0020A6E378|nr:YdcF family protein [Desulfuromonas sp. KJ2020]MCP3178126.1 YdcF family protein [Desulfuromonas sp. KJ2020]